MPGYVAFSQQGRTTTLRVMPGMTYVVDAGPSLGRRRIPGSAVQAGQAIFIDSGSTRGFTWGTAQVADLVLLKGATSAAPGKTCEIWGT